MKNGLARRLPLWIVVVAGVLVATSSAWAYRTLGRLDSEFFRPSRLGLRALAVYLVGDHAEAARLYRVSLKGRVTTTYPDDPSGLDAVVAGDLDTAERRARLTLALVPGAVEPRITLGELALDRGHLDDAL